MDKLRILFALLLLACAAGAAAQDVIVKKDGSTVVCRIVEVSASEIVYKKWTDLQGSNYVMNRADASVINYENGTRSEMGTANALSGETPSSVVLNPQSQQLSDMQLMEMMKKKSKPISMKKAKRLQNIGWIGGGVLMGAGIVLVSKFHRDTWKSKDLYNENGICTGHASTRYERKTFWSIGLGCIGAGPVFGASFVIAGKRMEHKVFELQSTTLWLQEIPLRNGSSLMAGVDRLQDCHTNTLGLGLRYNF